MTAPTLRMPAPPMKAETPAGPWWARALRFAGHWGWIALAWTVRAVWRLVWRAARRFGRDFGRGFGAEMGRELPGIVALLFTVAFIVGIWNGATR